MKATFLFYPLLFLALSILSCNNYGKEKSFYGVQLFYTDNITESEADAVGQYLIDQQFADGTTKTVQLDKQNRTYQFRMVVKKGIEQDVEYEKIFKQFAYELSNDIFSGADVDLHACDDQLETLRVYPMSPALE